MEKCNSGLHFSFYGIFKLLGSFLGLLSILHIELMEFALEKLLVGKLCLVFSDKGRRKRATERVFHDLVVLIPSPQSRNPDPTR